MAYQHGSRLQVGEPLRARIAPNKPFFNAARIACAQKGCPARIGTLECTDDGRSHRIGLDIVFAYYGNWVEGSVPMVRLRSRYAAQWKEAKKRGEPWSQFRLRARRARGGRSSPRSSEVDAGLDIRPFVIPFRFVCPVCERTSLADFSPECAPHCPYHCPTCRAARLVGRPHTCPPDEAAILARWASGVADSP